MTFIKNAATKTDWPCGARNVQIKLPTNAIAGGPLWGTKGPRYEKIQVG